MGERGAAREPATAEEIAQMAEIVAAGVAAGALGFSTSRTMNHRTSRGEPTPTLTASQDELIGIARALGRLGSGVLQVVSDHVDRDDEFDMFRRMVAESGRPLSFSLVQNPFEPESFRSVLARIDRARDEGLAITAQVSARGIGLLLGLPCTLHPFMNNPVFAEIADLPVIDQARAMADEGFKARVLEAAAGDKVRKLGGGLIHRFEAMFELCDPPDYEPDPTESIAARATREGRDAIDFVYDLIASDGGGTLLYLPALNFAGGNLDAVGVMLRHQHTVPGLGDGGAHVGTICDGSFPTTLLAHWGRDRLHDRIDLPFLVQRQCRDTARTVGPARSRCARAGLSRRPQRDRLPAATRPATRGAVRPAGRREATRPTRRRISAHLRRRPGSDAQRRADRGTPRPVGSRAADPVGAGRPVEGRGDRARSTQGGEVLVQIAASGMCHSDEHLVTGDLAGATPEPPLIGGHEGAGIVLEVGPGVFSVVPGDHVVFGFVPACGRCPSCASGHSNLCDLGSITATGMQLSDGTARHHAANGQDLALGIGALGTFAHHTVVHEASCIKIDKELPLDKACLLGCGVVTGWGSAVYAAQVQPGDTVAVVGCGGIGSNAIQGARLAGARVIAAIDPIEFKREKAMEFGATVTHAPFRTRSAALPEDTWSRASTR
jgi:D-arabinose 1-dehydrogenase-like Zn-dependent alcohol dehydrogenase